MNLHQKLLEIQKKVLGLGKDKSSLNYQYVTGDKVLSVIKPLMCKHGLLLKQEIISIENTRQDYATKNNPNKSEILSRVMQRFTWIDAETQEKDVSEFGANGQNDWDKGVGSALTYAERYFLLKFFHIATDQDDIDGLDREPQVDPIEVAIGNARICMNTADLKALKSSLPESIIKDKRFITVATARYNQLTKSTPVNEGEAK